MIFVWNGFSICGCDVCSCKESSKVRAGKEKAWAEKMKAFCEKKAEEMTTRANVWADTVKQYDWIIATMEEKDNA